MPLVVICGPPLSGKSYRARQLYEHLTSSDTATTANNHHSLVHLITDENHLTEHGPNQIYCNAAKEKELRSWLKSEVQRHLASSDTVVILDAANYIKGYRYELYCLSKQFRTTHVVLECSAAPDQIIESHFTQSPLSNCSQESIEEHKRRQYSESIFTELTARYEQPDPLNRWDSPLFTIAYHQPHPPYEDIKLALLKGVPLKPNQSTQSLPTTTDNFLYEIDTQTQEVIKQVQIALQMNQLRGIKIKGTDVQVNVNRKIPIAELNKVRRQFINYTRMHSLSEKERIVTAFVQFINKSVS